MNDKEILKEYIDACELVKETEADIARLEKRKVTIANSKVSGSNPEYPYNPQRFNITGSEYTYQDDVQLRREEKLILEQRANAERIKEQAEEVIVKAPLRIQRIIRFRYKDNLSWNAIAAKIGRGATPNSVRMELTRYLETKNEKDEKE